MDALTKLNEHFLSCNICTETFKDPCTLGCYHTFCRECLTKYTKTQRDAITAKSILCPNCRQMTKVPRPEEPVDQWCEQFKPSFLIQGLLDSFASQESGESIQNCCVTCQQIGKSTYAKSVCEDCDIMFCEVCAKMHNGIPLTSDHVISPLGAGSTPQLKKRKVMCKEHNCFVEFCCEDCQKAVCHTCCIVYHRKCHSVVTLDSMIPEMKQVLQQKYNDLELHRQQTEKTLECRRTDVEDVTKHKSYLQSEIRRVSQQAVDLIGRKEKKLLDELDMLTEMQTGELKGQIKSRENDLHRYQQYTEFIKQVLQSNSPMDLYEMYTLCQSGEITAEVKRHDKQVGKIMKVEFEIQFDGNKIDKNLQLGHMKIIVDNTNILDTPIFMSTISSKLKDDKTVPGPCDIEVLTIGGTYTLVITDCTNTSVKSCYRKNGKPHCSSIKLNGEPFSLTKISQNIVAVSYYSHNSMELIKLTPDPVRITTIKTKKKYICLTALSDTTLAAGCRDPPSIVVLDLSGRVLRSVITLNTSQQLTQRPLFMCTTRQGHILVADGGSLSVYCVTQQGEVLYTYQLTGSCWTGGVTTTDTGSVIVADYKGNKIVLLTERGKYVKDLLTERDGIDSPQGIRVHGNKLYVTEEDSELVKVYQLSVSD